MTVGDWKKWLVDKDNRRAVVYVGNGLDNAKEIKEGDIALGCEYLEKKPEQLELFFE